MTVFFRMLVTTIPCFSAFKSDDIKQHQEDISTVKRAFVEGEITLILARDIYRLLLRREKHHDDLITGSWEAKILLVIPVYLHEIRLARWKWDEEHAWRMETQTRAHASRMRRIELGGQWI